MDILPKSDINCIMVFRYISVDVIPASVADLHIDVAQEEGFREPHEERYNSSSCSAREILQHTKANDPTRNVPMWRAAALVFCLAHPLEYNEVFVPEAVGQEQSHAAD